MTDLPTIEDVKAELAEHDKWLQDFNLRQQQQPQILQRVAWLNGFVAASEQD